MNFHSPALQVELRAYNASMERSLEDKLFFLGHTAGAMTFVDFGCANGAVLKAVSERRERKVLVGVDNHPIQLDIARQKVPGAYLVPSFDHALPYIREAKGPRVAIFSSVLHETPDLIRLPAESGLFDFLVIRDMGVPSWMERAWTPKEWLEATRKAPAREEWLQAGRSVDRLDDFAEFLLKAPYLGNTPGQTVRELEERYPHRNIESFLDIGPDAEYPYAITHFEHYVAPWVQDRVRHDYGFEFPYPTHFKAILRKVTP